MATKATRSKSSVKASARSASKTSASKSVPARKSAKSSTPAKAPMANRPQSSTGKNTFKLRKSYLILAAVVLAIGLLIYSLKSLFVAAIVNGQPISRLAVVKETEKQSGKAAMDNLVRNALIEQEAREQNVTVTDKEIDDEIKKAEDSIEKQGRKMDDVLKTQGLTREDLRKLIRLDRLVNKMVGKDVKVSDEEVTTYIEQNRESLPQDQSEEQLRASVATQLRQQKLNENVQAWLAELQAKAKVQYFVQY